MKISFSYTATSFKLQFNRLSYEKVACRLHSIYGVVFIKRVRAAEHFNDDVDYFQIILFSNLQA